MEEIYKKFEVKRTKALKQAESKENELAPETERQILKETVSEHITTAQPISPIQQQAVVQSMQQIKNQPKERQIQLLIEMAFGKGVIEAVEVVKRLDNPYLLDEFHDALVDELYNKLVEQGKLKQI